MAVAAPPQFGSYADVDFGSLRDSYLQLFSLSHSVEVTRLSHVAAMCDAKLHAPQELTEDLAREEVASWLYANANMTYRESREHVRVALALRSLPVVADAFGRGELSFRQVEYLTEFLTPETEEDFMRSDVWFQSLAQLRRKAERARLERRPRAAKPAMSVSFPTKTRMVFNGTEVALAKAKAAIDRLAMAEGIDEVLGEYRPLSERRGDALMTIVSAAIAEDADPDRASIVIHMTQDVFESRRGVVTVNGELALFDDIADQICDSRVRLMYFRDGLPMGVGRMMRDAPPAIRAWLSERDGGCRFSGCLNTIGLHAHHIQWWSLGGPTDIDNLIMLCSRHHHLIHDKGWTIHGDPNFHVEFRDPMGRVFHARVPGLQMNVREFANQLLDDVTLFEPA